MYVKVDDLVSVHEKFPLPRSRNVFFMFILTFCDYLLSADLFLCLDNLKVESIFMFL